MSAVRLGADEPFESVEDRTLEFSPPPGGWWWIIASRQGACGGTETLGVIAMFLQGRRQSVAVVLAGERGLIFRCDINIGEWLVVIRWGV